MDNTSGPTTRSHALALAQNAQQGQRGVAQSPTRTPSSAGPVTGPLVGLSGPRHSPATTQAPGAGSLRPARPRQPRGSTPEGSTTTTEVDFVRARRHAQDVLRNLWRDADMTVVPNTGQEAHQRQIVDYLRGAGVPVERLTIGTNTGHQPNLDVIESLLQQVGVRDEDLQTYVQKVHAALVTRNDALGHALWDGQAIHTDKACLEALVRHIRDRSAWGGDHRLTEVRELDAPVERP